jgi:Xaa-Pro aminopeptidase
LSRISRLASSLSEPLLVTGPTNVRYLTGLESSNAAVLVTPDGEVTLYTDFRYARRARAIDGVAVVETARDLIHSLGEELRGRRVAVEAPHVTYDTYRRLGDAGLDLVVVGSQVGDIAAGPVEDLRRVKEQVEADAIRRACALSDEVLAELARERFTGRTERDLAWWIESAFHDAGAAGAAFATIVASGENGASPHAVPGDRVIEADTLVTIDMGCVVDGYCSDCTRTFATGELPSDLAEAYALCLQAQLDGLAAVRTGAAGRDVDAASRIAIEAAGLGPRYGHGLGHGVGLDVHEAPVLRPESEDVLAAGNVVSVEPGIYLAGVGGVRIEDLREPQLLGGGNTPREGLLSEQADRRVGERRHALSLPRGEAASQAREM